MSQLSHDSKCASVQAIIAEGGTGEALDQELSASGFQHQHQQVSWLPHDFVPTPSPSRAAVCLSSLAPSTNRSAVCLRLQLCIVNPETGTQTVCLSWRQGCQDGCYSDKLHRSVPDKAGTGSEHVLATLQVLQQFIRQDGHIGAEGASCSSSSEADDPTSDSEDEPQEQERGGASRPGTAADVGPTLAGRLQAASLVEADTQQEADPAGRAEFGFQQQGCDEPGGNRSGDQQAAGNGSVQEAESLPDHVVLRGAQAAGGSEAAGSSPAPAQVCTSLLPIVQDLSV